MSTELEEFFARARYSADALPVPPSSSARRLGDRRRRRRTAMIICSIFAVVAAGLGTVTLATRNRAHPSPATSVKPVPTTAPSGFATLHRAATGIPYGAAGAHSIGYTITADGMGYAAWRTENPDALVLGAVTLRTGKKAWGPRKIATSGDWGGLSVALIAETLIAVVSAPEGKQPDTTYYAIGLHDGRAGWHTSDRIRFVAADTVVTAQGDDLVGLDLHSGKVRWRLKGAAAAGTQSAPIGVDPQASVGSGPPVSFGRSFAVLDPLGRLRTIDAQTGKQVGTAINLPGRRLVEVAGTGQLYATSLPGTPLEIAAVAGDRIDIVYKGKSTVVLFLTSCFIAKICFVEGDHAVALDPATGRTVPMKPAFLPDPRMQTMYDRYVVLEGHTEVGGQVGEQSTYAVFDYTGKQVNTFSAAHGLSLTPVAGGAVFTPSNRAFADAHPTEYLVLTYDGVVSSLGQALVSGYCAFDRDFLFCLDDRGVGSWAFR